MRGWVGILALASLTSLGAIGMGSCHVDLAANSFAVDRCQMNEEVPQRPTVGRAHCSTATLQFY